MLKSHWLRVSPRECWFWGISSLLWWWAEETSKGQGGGGEEAQSTLKKQREARGLCRASYSHPLRLCYCPPQGRVILHSHQQCEGPFRLRFANKMCQDFDFLPIYWHKWYFGVGAILICISLIVSEGKHLHIGLKAISITIDMNCVHVFYPFFLLKFCERSSQHL